MKKIRLYIVGYKGYKVVENLYIQYGNEIFERVILGRDKGVDNDYFNETLVYCKKQKISVTERAELNVSDESYCGYAIAIGWKWLIDIVKVPKLIILHDSILPKYRGFNPLVTALINGDSEIGVTALFAHEEYDKGKIIDVSKCKITYPIKISEAIEKITISYVKLVKKLVDKIISDKQIIGKEQEENLAIYSLWRDEEDYRIDWSKNATYLKRFIDAVDHPYMGACTVIDNQIVRILYAEVFPDLVISNRTPGKVIFFRENKPVVVCGKGLLKINKMISDSDNSIFILKKFRTRFR